VKDVFRRSNSSSALHNFCSAVIVPVLLCGFLLSQLAVAQTTPPTPPTPTPDPLYPYVFYGAVNPTTAGFVTPVLVFVPGLGGVACNWYSTGTTGTSPCASGVANDMYAYAYQAGYRTAFITPNTTGAPGTTIAADAAVLAGVIPRVASYYSTQQIYFVGHSKGGLDLEEAILNSNIYPLVKGVFDISSPNQGTALATWAFANQSTVTSLEATLKSEYGITLNLLVPAVQDMEVANMATLRAVEDPIFEKSLAKPFYTWGGSGFYNSDLTLVTGGILNSLIPIVDTNSQNDGFVTVGESLLSPEFSNDMGYAPDDHFQMNQGDVSFPKISGRIQGIETTTNEFQRISVNGFARFGGNPYSSMIWSAKWFNNALYVGTGSAEVCFTFLTSDVRTGTSSYPAAVKADLCPSETVLAQNLAAEIWQYVPTTNTWTRVYQSPQNVPITVNGTAINTALDIGYRGMEVFTESNGTQALYVGTVTSGSAFQPSPFQPNGYPGPRILRTTDGVTWTPIPQDAGTFLGSLQNYYLNSSTIIRSFRSLTSFNGQLYATAGSYEGSGIIIASSNPSAGDNAWQQVSPAWNVLPSWDIKVFNNLLYTTTGFTVEETQEGYGGGGYGVYYTAATGSAPYTWVPVVIEGGWQTNTTYQAPNGLALFVFLNELYVATDRPTELIRIRPDNSWDLIVGAARTLPSTDAECPNCVKTPLSGMGNGFDNGFTGHFWRLGSITGASADQNSTGQNLFLGTWDWSDAIQQFGILSSLDAAYTHQYGTDVYRTEDGVHFTPVTQTGFGDPNNEGTRTLESTPMGLILGTAREKYGAEVFLRTQASTTPLAAPRRLRADSGQTSGQTVNLYWDPPPNAVMFNVYRATVPATGLSVSATLALPGTKGEIARMSIEDIRSGKASYLCKGADAASSLCTAVHALSSTSTSIPGSFPLQYGLVGQTTTPTYSETAPSTMQSLYYVRAVDSKGNLSDVSNVVGGPSASAPIPAVTCDIDGDGFVDGNDITLIEASIGTPAYGSSDPRAPTGDATISAADATFCVAKCNNASCALQ
jgi:hypothetical protein